MAFNANNYQSTLKDPAASWQPGALAGKFVVPDTSFAATYRIVSNGTNTITVLGDLSAQAFGGRRYQIQDFHLRSVAGHWEAGIGTWATDAEFSPCIDAGDPASDWSNEPAPNGGRVNMGAYANTPEASKSAARPPVAPAYISASDGAYNDRVAVTWGPVTGTVSYAIWRSTTTNFADATHVSAGADPATNRYVDMAVLPLQTYRYWVQAQDGNTLGPLSAPDGGFAGEGVSHLFYEAWATNGGNHQRWQQWDGGGHGAPGRQHHGHHQHGQQR